MSLEGQTLPVKSACLDMLLYLGAWELHADPVPGWRSSMLARHLAT